MKEYGYIRKIDELGRIVIPKELREQLKIQDNENIIINSENEAIYIKKYSYILNQKNYISNIGNIFYEQFKIPVTIYDRESIIFKTASIKTNYMCEEEIILNSVAVGKVELYYNENNIFYGSLCKFLAKVIALSLSSS